MPVNPYNNTIPVNVVTGATVNASDQNELNEYQRFLNYAVSSKTKLISGLQSPLSVWDSYWRRAIEKGVWDLKGCKPLAFNDDTIFAANTAQLMSALFYREENVEWVYKTIYGVGNPVIYGNIAPFIPKNCILIGFTFANNLDFTLNLGSSTASGLDVIFANANKRPTNIRKGDYLYIRSGTFANTIKVKKITDSQRTHNYRFTLDENTLTAGDRTACFYLKVNVEFKNCTFLNSVNIRNTWMIRFMDCIWFDNGSDKLGKLLCVPYDDNLLYSDIWFPKIIDSQFITTNPSGLLSAMIQFDGAIMGCHFVNSIANNISGTDLSAIGVDFMTFGIAPDQAVSSIMTDNNWGCSITNEKLNVPVSTPIIGGDPPSFTFKIWREQPPLIKHNNWNGVAA